MYTEFGEFLKKISRGRPDLQNLEVVLVMSSIQILGEPSGSSTGLLASPGALCKVVLISVFALPISLRVVQYGKSMHARSRIKVDEFTILASDPTQEKLTFVSSQFALDGARPTAAEITFGLVDELRAVQAGSLPGESL